MNRASHELGVLVFCSVQVQQMNVSRERNTESKLSSPPRLLASLQIPLSCSARGSVLCKLTQTVATHTHIAPLSDSRHHAMLIPNPLPATLAVTNQSLLCSEAVSHT